MSDTRIYDPPLPPPYPRESGILVGTEGDDELVLYPATPTRWVLYRHRPGPYGVIHSWECWPTSGQWAACARALEARGLPENGRIDPV